MNLLQSTSQSAKEWDVMLKGGLFLSLVELHLLFLRSSKSIWWESNTDGSVVENRE